MSGNTPILIAKKSQEAVIQFYNQCYTLTGQQYNLRGKLEQVDRAYMRELDWTKANQRAKLANNLGDADRLQNIQLPVILPAVEGAVTYQASVFLTGNPLFGVVSDASNQDAAMQLETVIDDQAIRGGWTNEFMKVFRDGFKYNLAAMEVPWVREITPALETDISFAGGKQGKPKEVLWEGNTIKHLDMYNIFFDTRVKPTEICTKGEFAGYTELMSRIQLKDFINKLPDKMIDNVRDAFESGLGTSQGIEGGLQSYYLPQLNPNALINKNTYATTDWMAWAQLINVPQNGNPIQYKNIYQVTTLYGRILPSDFGIKVPSANTPQVWKFIIINNQVLLYAERQTNAHQWIPILFLQPNDDGLAYQTKSLADNVDPIQKVSSALMNSVIAARRRAISDRGIFDPSRITEANINSANPSAKIPVRPSAYGKPLSDAYYPIPFRDENSAQIMQMLPQFQSMANIISGQNPAKQGQFVKGNKTLHEYADVMAHANGRDQMTSLLIECQLMTPLKYILKTNILQYQGGLSLYNRNKEQMVAVDPVLLRKTVLQFKVSDGLLPSDKIISGDVLQSAFQVLGSSPALSSQYNVGPLFSYLIKTQGGDIKQFEKPPEQVAYEQSMMQWSQLAQQVAQSGGDISKLPPQPIPGNYGYNPQQQGAPQMQSDQKVTNTIQNITKNQQPGNTNG